jgi:hypothetical protein
MSEDRATPKEVKARIENMLGFLTSLTSWFDQMKQLPRSTLIALMKLGGKVATFLPKGKEH